MTSGASDTEQRNLTSISPFFIVKDLHASIAHYIERFGFTLDFQGPPDGVYYGHVSRDGIGIMLKAVTPDVLPRPNHTRHEWARWDACIYTVDPDTLFAEFQRRGAAFVKELSFIERTGFLRPFITRPNIAVGEYTYYDNPRGPEHAIVGGNPGAVLRYRFDETTINRLQQLQWRAWEVDKVSRNVQALCAGDLDALESAA